MQNLTSRIPSLFNQYITPVLRAVFDLFAKPSARITDMVAYGQARLLSSLILMAIAVIILLVVRPDDPTAIGEEFEHFILMFTAGILSILYFASRSHHYLPTAIATVTLLIVSILAIFNATASEIDYAYLVIVMLMASALFDLRLLGVTIGATFVGTIAIIIDHPELSFNSESFVFFIVASLAIIVTSLHRNRQEFHRNETLVDREARLQLMLEQMPAILWTTDENLVFTSSNGSGFNSISVAPDALVGTWISSAPPMEKLSMFRTDVHYRALEGHSGTYESQWGDHAFQCFVEPLYDAKHHIIGCVGVALDVTARRDAEQVALDLRMEKERVQVLAEFIQNASHDLSTPLSVINASIYLLRNSDDPARQRRHIDTLAQQTEHLDNLVSSMLTMLRLDKMDYFSKSDVNLNQLMDSIQYTLETQISIKRLKLVKDFDPLLPMIEANESYLAQALEEILTNAVQFTNVGGTITLRTRHERERVLIEISDTGIGIAPEDQIRIFERFYRVDKARSANTGGTGLGLAIARKVVDGHAGRIHIQSAPGEGTTIRIYLPIEPELYLAMHN